MKTLLTSGCTNQRGAGHYIRYYNTRRISLKFKGLSPVEYRLKSYPGRN
ncbi:IS3 family transposase (plasmid) [Klebsiella pneumoniae]|nr:IS3 family transposase [Klebsiella pneumoniae]EKU7812457.1 IS3 family transposase [Klebsiella aerogenes]MCQ3851809.1 IS3 family transposase [Klebsiella variicola]HBQ6585699.1 IS3 family transposase [Klebsiella variicola subsp. variicola]HDH1376404.1 IS3 family transposase [Klebsiella quasipneumoniae subsp. similipneumoniae]